MADTNVTVPQGVEVHPFDAGVYWNMYKTDPVAQNLYGLKFQVENDWHLAGIIVFFGLSIILCPVAIFYTLWWLKKKDSTMRKYKAYLDGKGINPSNYKPFNYN